MSPALTHNTDRCGGWVTQLSTARAQNAGLPTPNVPEVAQTVLCCSACGVVGWVTP